MCLRLMYLRVMRVVAWLRLSGREESWTSAEILLLRHQLTVLHRQIDARPKPTWADRALLSVLFSVIPKARQAALRMIVAPDTVLRWHREIVRRRWVHKSQRKVSGRRRTHRNVRTLVMRLRPVPEGVVDPDALRVQRRGRIGNLIHEYSLVA